MSFNLNFDNIPLTQDSMDSNPATPRFTLSQTSNNFTTPTNSSSGASKMSLNNSGSGSRSSSRNSLVSSQMVKETPEQVFNRKKLMNASLEFNPEFIEVEEVIDLSRLVHIYYNLPQLGLTQFKIGRDAVLETNFKNALQSYIRSFKVVEEPDGQLKGVRTVRYTQHSKFREGRFIADNYYDRRNILNLQNMYRPVRHTIQAKYLVDVDQVASHVNLMLHICQEYDLQFPTLKFYLENRDKCHNDLMYANNLNKDSVKSRILAVLNGGGNEFTFSKPTQWWLEYIAESKQVLIQIFNDLKENNPEYIYKFQEKKKPGIMIGSVINNLLCNYENATCFYMRQFFQNKGYVVASINHDGAMFLKDDKLPNMNEYLDECVEYVKLKTNIYMPLKIKEPDEGLNILDVSDIDLSLGVFQDDLNFESEENLKHLMLEDGQRGLSMILSHFWKDNIINIPGISKHCFQWDDSTALWEECPDDDLLQKIGTFLKSKVNIFYQPLLQQISKLEKNNKETKQEYEELNKQISNWKTVIADCNKTASLVSIFKQAKPKFKRKDITMMNGDKDYFPISKKNKIHLPTLTVSKRNKNDYWTWFSNVDFIPDVNTPQMQEVKQYFLDICCGDKQYATWLATFLSYCLTGHVSHFRAMAVIYGQGKNSKSVLIQMLESVLNKAKVTLSEGALLNMGRKSNTGRATTELNDLVGARCAIYNETERNDNLDSKTIKGLTGGDTLKIRKLYQEEQNLEALAKVIFVSNHKIRFDATDKALASRIVCIPMDAVFESNQETIKKVATFKEKCKSAFFSHLCYHVKLFYDNQNLLRILPNKVQEATFNILIQNDSVELWLKDNILNGYEYCKADKKEDFDRLLSKQSNYHSIGSKKGLLFSKAYENYKTYHLKLEILQSYLSKEDFTINLQSKQYIKNKNSSNFLEYVVDEDSRYHLVLKELVDEKDYLENLIDKPVNQEREAVVEEEEAKEPSPMKSLYNLSKSPKRPREIEDSLNVEASDSYPQIEINFVDSQLE
jgi:P4 family phage/plasmid primase-like protien